MTTAKPTHSFRVGDIVSIGGGTTIGLILAIPEAAGDARFTILWSTTASAWKQTTVHGNLLAKLL